jgi:N-acetylmuramoyl-L-alanine amidase
MSSLGKQLVAMATLPLVTMGMVLSAPIHAAEIAPTPLAPDTFVSLPTAPLTIATTAPIAAAGKPDGRISMLLAGAALSWSKALARLAGDSDAPEAAAQPTETAAADDTDDADIECMAKVVHHEARNQSHEGQLAVAQLIMNRVESGRFAGTACAVANQPGQFFRTASYNPRRDSADWANALEVAREARNGSGSEVAPGALFFHAAYASANSFFRTRQRVATLGDHVFYR